MWCIPPPTAGDQTLNKPHDTLPTQSGLNLQHLLDSHCTQITAYNSMQLGSKSSSFILYIIHMNSLSISFCIWALKC